MRDYFEILKDIVELDYGPDADDREEEREELIRELRSSKRPRSRDGCRSS